MAILDGHYLSPMEAAGWWLGDWRLRLLADVRFKDSIAVSELDPLMIQGKGSVFMADQGRSWMVVSPAANQALFIDFMFSSLPMAIARLTPLLIKVLMDGGYQQAQMRAWSASQERLFTRLFGEKTDDFFVVTIEDLLNGQAKG